jgi:DNA mismatch endonuclease, patch repair protein
MSKIRSKNTNPELIVRRYLHKHGFRYRLHTNKLPGKSDIVLPKYKTAVFVHGCFWHAHEGCKYYREPKTNAEYWVKKLKRNISRDIINRQTLKENGWKVVVVWECELKRDPELRCSNLIGEILYQGSS